MYITKNTPVQLQKLLWVAVLVAIFLALNTEAFAKAWVDETTPINSTTTQLVKDAKVTLKTDKPFSQVRVANSDIADVVILTNKSFYITGKSRGKTNVLLYDEDSRLMDMVEIDVGYDMSGLKKSLFQTFPKERIEVRKLANRIYLSGNVSTGTVYKQAEKIAQAYAGKSVTNGLVVRDSHQVMLEVRFVEASRNAIKELGLGLMVQQAGQFSFFSGVGAMGGSPAATALLHDTLGPNSIDVRIEALEEKGVIRTLATPNLISMSGESASFLAGGEFPIPISGRNGEIAIEFRQFGVGLSFTPTVLDDGVINLKVKPEVSQLDPTNSVRVGGVEVPSLTIRRADTTVELRNSQSFAIAGLLQNTQTNKSAQVPWLGDVPVLGTLFRSTRYNNKETELVIIVTPKLVKPASDISQLSTPLDDQMMPSEMEFFLNGNMDGHEAAKRIGGSSNTKTAAAGGLAASYGHVLQ